MPWSAARLSFKMLEDFKQAAVNHSFSDVVSEVERIGNEIEIVRDLEYVQQAEPENFGAM